MILTVKEIQAAHQGTLDEVRDRVISDYQQEQSLVLARKKAEDLSKRAQGGEAFDKAAKDLSLEAKTADPISRSGSIPDLGSAKQFEAAFEMPVGQVSAATQLAGNWFVYRIVGHTPANMADLPPQVAQIRAQVLQQKQSAAFEAFRTALEDRLKAEGKLSINPEMVKRLTSLS